MRRSSKLWLLPLLALAACDGGGGSGGGGTPPAPIVTPTPSPLPSPTGSPVPFPTPTPVTGDFFTRAAAMFAVAPGIETCQPGQLSAQTTANLLQTFNAIRALHRLPPVVYSSADEPAAQASALMMAANNQLSHQPPASWRCYSAAGADAAASSNLYGGFGNGLTLISDEQVLAGWLTEVDNLVVENVGHRRWMLDPFLGSIAYGRVAGRHPTSTRADAAVMKVFDTQGPVGPRGPVPPIVAYPFEDYPARLFDTRALLSFSAVPSSTSRWANAAVDYSAATIEVRRRGGEALTVSRVAYDTQGYGLPNNLQFFAAGLQANQIYDVTIANVRVGGAARSYSYWFRIVA